MTTKRCDCATDVTRQTIAIYAHLEPQLRSLASYSQYLHDTCLHQAVIRLIGEVRYGMKVSQIKQVWERPDTYRALKSAPDVGWRWHTDVKNLTQMVYPWLDAELQDTIDEAWQRLGRSNHHTLVLSVVGAFSETDSGTIARAFRDPGGQSVPYETADSIRRPRRQLLRAG